MKPKIGKENQTCAPAGALYVHVPFCRAKCRYCDFYSLVAAPGLAGKFIIAASAELAARMGELVQPASTVFFGGGTPTVLGAAMLGRLLAIVRPFIDDSTEFSVEANPGTVDSAIADTLTAAGVNRVNLGVQSFIASELATLGRIHSAAEAIGAVATMRRAGAANLGLDLIYGVPGQTLQTWKTSVRQALELSPDHLSCYALSFEHGTPLWQDLQDGRASEMDDSLQKDCYFAAIELAAAAGLEHYEISNFAKKQFQIANCKLQIEQQRHDQQAPPRQCGDTPTDGYIQPLAHAGGFRCRHNLTYWHNEPYLGIGPGAASFVGGVRRTNLPDLDAYISAASTGCLPPANQEHLTGRPAMAETLMLGLRLIEGVSRATFLARFGQDPVDAFPRTFSRYQALSAVEVTTERIRLSQSALFVADTILADLIAEAD